MTAGTAYRTQPYDLIRCMTYEAAGLVEATLPERAVFRSRLHGILGRRLNTETLDTYATDALNDLVQLADDVIAAHALSTGGQPAAGRDYENTAFTHYGLEDLDSAIGHVADVAETIHRLPSVIARAQQAGHTIVPTPAGSSVQMPDAEQSYRRAATAPRLETTLVVLHHGFGIELDTDGSVQLAAGTVPRAMFRESSYYLVRVPSLNRLILVNNEVRHATYVFDTAAAASCGFDDDVALSRMTKPELNRLLEVNPQLGQRIIYDPRTFATRMHYAVQDPSIRLKTMRSEHDVLAPGRRHLYLYPLATEEVASITAFARQEGISRYAAVTALSELMKEGVVSPDKRIFNTAGGAALTDADRQAVLERAKLKNLHLPPADAGTASPDMLAKAIHSSASTVAAVHRLHVRLGMVEQAPRKRFGAREAFELSPRMQWLIAEHLLHHSPKSITRRHAELFLAELSRREVELAEA